MQENRTNCTDCHASLSIRGEHAFDFIASACVPEDAYVSSAIGNWHTHDSHHIALYGGILFCVKWGSIALNTIINLEYACPGSVAALDGLDHAHGAASIKRNNEGRAPLGYPNWPYNKFEVSLDTISGTSKGNSMGLPRMSNAPPPPWAGYEWGPHLIPLPLLTWQASVLWRLQLRIKNPKIQWMPCVCWRLFFWGELWCLLHCYQTKDEWRGAVQVLKLKTADPLV